MGASRPRAKPHGATRAPPRVGTTQRVTTAVSTLSPTDSSTAIAINDRPLPPHELSRPHQTRSCIVSATMASSLHLQLPSRPSSSSPRSSISSNSSHTHESTVPPPQQLLEQHEMAPIEARSLAPVIKLAANPPLEIPNVDAASQRSSLLLWIVRVPESNGLLKLLLPIHVTHTQWTN